MIKILTYNIHKGFTIANRRYMLQELQVAIAELNCDFIFLQEVVGQNHRHAQNISNWAHEAQSDTLAGEHWPHRSYGKNAVYLDGHHGNAILSKDSLISAENLDISTNRFESRGLLHAVAQCKKSSSPLHLLCLHLDLLEKGRKKQLEHVCRRIDSAVPSNEPLLIAGEALEKKLGVLEAHKHLHGVYAKTYPSFLPYLCLDRIYLRGFVPSKCYALSGAPWNRLSDHLPIILEISPS